MGLTEDQAQAQGIKVKKGLFPWNASGSAIANGRDERVTKLLLDDCAVHAPWRRMSFSSATNNRLSSSVPMETRMKVS